MNVTSKTAVHIVIEDESLRDSVHKRIDADYDTYLFGNVEASFSAENQNSVALILCEQGLLNSDQANIFSQFKRTYPNARILVIGPHCSSDAQISVLRNGARGYFDNSLSLDNLSNAFHCVLMGEVWVERHVISGLIDELSDAPKVSEDQLKLVELLSPKEREVAELVSHGATNKKIAYEMEITERTVKSHLTTIFHKMGISDRLSLAIFFRDLR